MLQYHKGLCAHFTIQCRLTGGYSEIRFLSPNGLTSQGSRVLYCIFFSLRYAKEETAAGLSRRVYTSGLHGGGAGVPHICPLSFCQEMESIYVPSEKKKSLREQLGCICSNIFSRPGTIKSISEDFTACLFSSQLHSRIFLLYYSRQTLGALKH